MRDAAGSTRRSELAEPRPEPRSDRHYPCRRIRTARAIPECVDAELRVSLHLAEEPVRIVERIWSANDGFFDSVVVGTLSLAVPLQDVELVGDPLVAGGEKVAGSPYPASSNVPPARDRGIRYVAERCCVLALALKLGDGSIAGMRLMPGDVAGSPTAYDQSPGETPTRSMRG